MFEGFFFQLHLMGGRTQDPLGIKRLSEPIVNAATHLKREVKFIYHLTQSVLKNFD